jgi:hypothetical protein
MGPVEQDPRHAGDHEPVHDPDATCPGRVERSNRCSRPWWASRPPCWKPAASCHSSSSAGPPARRRGSSWAAGLGPPAVGDLRLCNRELAGPRRQRVGSAPEIDDPDPPCSRITGSAGLTFSGPSDTDLANEPVHWLPPAGLRVTDRAHLNEDRAGTRSTEWVVVRDDEHASGKDCRCLRPHAISRRRLTPRVNYNNRFTRSGILARIFAPHFVAFMVAIGPFNQALER